MANEKRLNVIDRGALLEAIEKSDRENFHKGVANRSIHHYEHRHFMNMVLNAPTVDAVEVVHGHWVSLTECSNAGVYCSVCRKKVWKEDYAWCNRKNRLRSNYCPNCGAKMDGGTENV